MGTYRCRMPYAPSQSVSADRSSVAMTLGRGEQCRRAIHRLFESQNKNISSE